MLLFCFDITGHHSVVLFPDDDRLLPTQLQFPSLRRRHILKWMMSNKKKEGGKKRCARLSAHADVDG